MEGYILMGFGKKYVDECRMAVDMINVFDKKRPKAIMTNKSDEEYARSLGVFDDIVIVDFAKEPLLAAENNPHNLYCVIPRILMPKYLPYEKTIALDSDIVTISDPSHVWDFFNATNQAFSCCGYDYERVWHWGRIDEIIAKFGKSIPSIHGGVLYFNKSHPDMGKFLNDCIDICKKYDHYGCHRFFRGGMTDEVIFAMAMANQNYKPLHYTKFPIVSFNLPPTISLPFYGQTRTGHSLDTVTKTEKPTVFNHIFFHEAGGEHYFEWYLKFYEQVTGKKREV